VVLLAGLGVAWIGLGGVLAAFGSRGIQASRLELWRDMLPMVPRFPVFGVGWNAFATAYPWYRTLPGPDWVGEAHNEYLQALTDGGVVGAGLALGLLAVALRGAIAQARASPLGLGLLGALVGLALNALADFSWQIPANAATWTALAALATRPARHPDRGVPVKPSRRRPEAYRRALRNVTRRPGGRGGSFHSPAARVTRPGSGW
jgi:O-antigen ligase